MISEVTRDYHGYFRIETAISRQIESDNEFILK